MASALSEYFIREAGEYLDDLDRLLREASVPDAERIFRLARGVRGSAYVAKVEGIVDVAARLEGAARYLLEGRIPWSEELRERALRTVADLQALLPTSVMGWGPAEAARAQEAVARWGGFAEIARTPPSVPQGQPVFSFVRTELSGVVDVLEQAIRQLRQAPRAEEPLREILARIRALRGVAGSDPLAPVLEVLDGIDELARSLVTDGIPVEGERLDMLVAGYDALRDALAALERDEPPPGGGSGLERFRALRARVCGDGDDAQAGVVPVRDLFFDDGGPHVVASPVAPAGAEGGSEAPAEVTEFLRLEATKLLDRAEAVLAGAGAGRGLARVGRRLGDLASAVRELAASYGLAGIERAAESAAARLASVDSAADARSALTELRAALAPAAAGVDVAAIAAPAAPEAEDADGVVPIESLVLRGSRALEEALALKPEIERLLRGGPAQAEELQRRMRELWDLVEAGAEEPRR